jgi:DNA-binding transcriptional ArsR family regulator
MRTAIATPPFSMIVYTHGIVDDRREGNVVFYRLLIPCVTNFFSCATQVLKERA